MVRRSTSQKCSGGLCVNGVPFSVGRKERAGRAHLANDLAVFGFVADEEIALHRRDERGENEQHDGGGE